MKVLILSHNPITDQSNMGKTFLSLFSSFQKDELCQLYIYPTIPNQDRCSSYYRMTDKDMVNWLLKRKKIGRVITKDQIRQEAGSFEEEKDEGLYRNPKNKSALRRLLRDMVWRLAKWRTPELDLWLQQEMPECIFVAPGVACFLYDIALYVARKMNIPIITYICDEYYFVKEPRKGLDRYRLGMLRKKIRNLMAQSSCLAVISQELKVAYEVEFSTPAHVLMTGSSAAIAEHPRITQMPTEIRYFGNIRCNRYISLGEIGAALDQINREKGTNYRLKIYSAEKNEEILSRLNRHDSIELCGFVAGKAFQETFEQAELLLHTEAFDEASVDFVKHSVSTKIADCLASGIPLVAYAPASISSMQHLMRNHCALAVTDRELLKETLTKAFESGEELRQISTNALVAAKQFHDREKVSRQLYEIMCGVISASKE